MSRTSTQQGRGSSDFCKKKVWLSGLRPSRLLRVSQYTQFVTRHVLNSLPSQDNKASTDGVQVTLGMFNVLFGDNVLVSCLTGHQIK